MSESGTVRKKVRVRYMKDKDYRMVYADGAAVGYADGKAITLDFYVGHFTLPEELYVWNPDKNSYKQEDISRNEWDYERDLKVQIVMTPENVDVLQKMINEKIKEFKTQATNG